MAPPKPKAAALPAPTAQEPPGRGKLVRGGRLSLDKLTPEQAATLSACPFAGAVRVIAVAESGTDIGNAAGNDWTSLSLSLADQSERIADKDLSGAERMLFGQAVALQSLFVRLTEGALRSETVTNYEMKFRYALRAQAQCRATLETLAAIKNPPVVFARQANVSAGPQQVNNGIARAETAEFQQIELSGAAVELSTNGGAPPPTFAPHSPVAPVGEIDGAAHDRGQEPIIAQRLEGRGSRRASRAAKTSAPTEAQCRASRNGGRKPPSMRKRA